MKSLVVFLFQLIFVQSKPYTHTYNIIKNKSLNFCFNIYSMFIFRNIFIYAHRTKYLYIYTHLKLSLLTLLLLLVVVLL